MARTAGIDTNDCSSCRLSVDGAFGLSEEDRALYAACDKSGKAQDGRDCTGVEKQCYRCYCYSSITSGRLRLVTCRCCADHTAQGLLASLQACAVHHQQCSCSQHVQHMRWRKVSQAAELGWGAHCAAAGAAFCSDSSYCSSALGLLALQYSSQVGVVLAILGINMLLALISRSLTLFEKHHTRSSEARSLAHRLFLAQVRGGAAGVVPWRLVAHLKDWQAGAGSCPVCRGSYSQSRTHTGMHVQK